VIENTREQHFSRMNAVKKEKKEEKRQAEGVMDGGSRLYLLITISRQPRV